ncbi:MAG: type III polyketide synthase [Planctomycetes bacterium]|nr:type III polyketide synthase [Planctomycetota bacterium]
MMIASVASALPENVYPQAVLSEYLKGVWSDRPEILRRMDTLHENVQVEQRHIALPLERYAGLRTFSDFNAAWIEQALLLGERALDEALRRAGLAPRDVDAIYFSTVTGLASPSIDARLVNRMGLRADVKRNPLFGLGCVAGAAAVSRAADYVRAFPSHVAVVLTIELCSLTLQREDPSIANVISSGLFGDGACAAVVVGAERGRALDPRAEPGPRVRATRSVFYPDTEDVMGWSIGTHGFRIVLSAQVPEVARERVRPDLDRFLGEHGLTRSDVRSWVCHPGGPKVLQALEQGLELAPDALALSWDSLRRAGNLSSASVLLILEQTLERARPSAGSPGVMLAMGPGFCSEFLLLGW